MTDAPPVAVVGAGPTGLACAIELQKRQIASVCYDRGGILHTIYRMPEEMRWFSTRDLLGIADVPFPGPEPHPTRIETLAYYRGVAEAFGVSVQADTEILSIESPGSGLLLRARRDGQPLDIAASEAVLATGFFDNPRALGVPGEDLSHVHRRYVSGYPFHGRDVVVIGGKNSASEAALDLYRHGARVTLVVRAEALSDRVKYWIKPDLENRIRAGSIRAFFSSRVRAIERGRVALLTPAGEKSIPADAVFPLIGYEPDFGLFERCGIAVSGDNREPVHDPETLESSTRGIYLAGALLGGSEIGRIFIENSRHHAAMIADAIAKARGGSASSRASATFLPSFRTSVGSDPDR